MAQTFKFLIKSKTLSEWNADQEGLLAGELVFDKTTNRLKVGVGGLFSAGPYIAPDVIDNLTSDDSTKALSAKQGKALKTLIEQKADASNLPSVPEIVNDLNTDSPNKVLSAAQGVTLKTQINSATAELTQIINNTTSTMSDAPKDGRSYARRNGQWDNLLDNITLDMPEADKQVNAQGTRELTVILPFKYAMNATDTAIKDILHRDWPYPYTNGRIKKIRFQAGVPDGTYCNVKVGGRNVLPSAVAVTTNANDWHGCDFQITLNELIEISTTQSYNAEDLTVEILFQCGNAYLEFIGENDLRPNVYALELYKNSSADNPSQVYISNVTNIYKIFSGNIFYKGIDTNYISSASNFEARHINTVIYFNNNKKINTWGSPIYFNKHLTTYNDLIGNRNIVNVNSAYDCTLLLTDNGDVIVFGGESYRSVKQSKIISSSTIQNFYAFNVRESDGSYIIFDNGNKCGLITYQNSDYAFMIFNPPTGKKIKQVLGIAGKKTASGSNIIITNGIYINKNWKTFILTQDGEIYYTEYDGTSSTFNRPIWNRLLIDNDESIKIDKMFKHYLVTIDNKIYCMNHLSENELSITYEAQFPEEILEISTFYGDQDLFIVVSNTQQYLDEISLTPSLTNYKLALLLTKGLDRNKLYVKCGANVRGFISTSYTKYDTFTEVLQNYHIDNFIIGRKFGYVTSSGSSVYYYTFPTIYFIGKKLGDTII